MTRLTDEEETINSTIRLSSEVSEVPIHNRRFHMRSIFLALAVAVGFLFVAPQRADAVICNSYRGYTQHTGNCTIYEFLEQVVCWDNDCHVTVVFGCMHSSCCVKAIAGCDAGTMCTTPGATAQACGYLGSTTLGFGCPCPGAPGGVNEFLVVLYLAHNTGGYGTCPCVSSCISSTVTIDIICY